MARIWNKHKQTNTPLKRKVFVGLSGGVDSATSAALLKERGFNVVGVFIKIWQPEFIECTWREDRLDAMRAAVTLGIPFREIDLSVEYKKEVVQTIIDGYQRGITPNPDVLCNRSIKFGHFARWAFAEGADFVATGHYARIRERGGRYELLRGLDGNKDQSYFLSMLTEEDLSRTFFPVGELRKSEVRERAKKFGLPMADKPDSQGLCFIGDVSMRDFLSRYIALAQGIVVDTHGTTVGTHDGAALYTIGQRHGFTIGGAAAQEGPSYITKIDVANNILSVSHDRADAASTRALVEHMRWLGEAPALPHTTTVQTRYREAPVSARLSQEGEYIRVEFVTPHIVSPGQILAAYDGEVMQGSGVIR